MEHWYIIEITKIKAYYDYCTEIQAIKLEVLLEIPIRMHMTLYKKISLSINNIALPWMMLDPRLYIG